MKKTILNHWRCLSIIKKALLILLTTIGSMWILIFVIEMRLISFGDVSSEIMSDYIYVTDYLNKFADENMLLDIYIRPSRTSADLDVYSEAIGCTDVELEKMLYSEKNKTISEKAMLNSIGNAMETYRQNQKKMISAKNEDERIKYYVILKRQAVYLDSYARNLLHDRMTAGEARWEKENTINTHHRQMVYIMMMAVTVLTLVMLVLFFRTFLRPLKDLGEAAENVAAGEYDLEPLPVRSEDEIGRTMQSFNIMVSEVRSHIRMIEDEADAKKALLEAKIEKVQMQHALNESRFGQLQSQINPHFLFNALTTIAAVADEEQAKDAEELIMRLAKFFRYSLEQDDQYVTIGREIDFLNNYMKIQKARFGERIEFVTDIFDQDCLFVHIPKFLLQPIVENSIVHGLKDVESGGLIRLSVKKMNNDIVVKVKDNGCGFDPDHMDKNQTHKSVGLDNIKERLVYAGCSLKIDSVINKGTEVTIIIPGERT